MTSRAARSLLVGVALAFACTAVLAQVALRVRGTITGMDGDVLSVKTREGKDLKLRLSDKTVVVAAIRLEDLEPASMMPNGAGTPIVTTVNADRSALKAGEYIFTTAAVAADGTLTTQRITVSRDGVKPPR